MSSFVLQPNESSLYDSTNIAVDHLSVDLKPAGWYRQEVTSMRLNVTADLSPLFHWNTKQLFVYLTADYESSDGTKNSVVVWDSIIRDERDANINLKKKVPKYPLRDPTHSFFKAKPATYSLHYDIMPYIGMLRSGKAGTSAKKVAFPARAAKAKAKGKTY